MTENAEPTAGDHPPDRRIEIATADGSMPT
jgi:hypothetical protein